MATPDNHVVPPPIRSHRSCTTSGETTAFSMSPKTFLSPRAAMLWLVVLAAAIGAVSSAQYDFLNCAATCDEDACPALTYCEGKPVKDACNCCTICSDDKFQPHAARPLSVPTSGGEACKQVDCPKFKICSENMQGLPLCKCPSTFFCRKKKKREVCASDGKTYPSRCHMRVASCHLGSAVRKKYRGQCSPEKDRKMRKRRLRQERRRAREEEAERGMRRKSGRKNGKDRQERKRKRTNRKRRKIGGRRSRGKRRTRRHRRNHRLNLEDLAASRAFEEAFAHYTWSK